jgi:1-acyl-sn-glycerol-3-phosphate acyltransferase
MQGNTSHQEELRVDVRKIFYEKNPRMAKLLPGFIYRYVERIAHQDFINGFLSRHRGKRGLDFIHAVFDEFNTKITIKGEENIPRQGRYIFASNHPLGGFDGIILLDTVTRYLGDSKFLVNDILMNLRLLDDVFIPINTHGAQSKESALLLDKVFRSDMQVLTFPSGMVSRKLKGEIKDLVWKKNFIAKAIQYQRDIVPVHFSGKNSNFFYNLSNIRTFLHIKWNLEMFFLVDESMKHRNSEVTVSFGQPVKWTSLDGSKTYQEWADFIREKTYSLPEIFT